MTYSPLHKKYSNESAYHDGSLIAFIPCLKLQTTLAKIAYYPVLRYV
ncbi:hypothetical protein [Vibrio tritonius]|nr:hypothetical protein [Vibrio tritonius]